MKKGLFNNRVWLMAFILTLVLALVACSNPKTTRVGNDRYGYFTVPEDWIEQNDSSNSVESIQYIDPDRQIAITCIVYTTVDLTEALTNIHAFMDTKELDDILEEVITLDGGNITSVYKIYFHYPELETYIATYLFDGPDGVTRYLSAESKNDSIAQGIDIIEKTYSLTK
ncbi:MAG: hypothetical protein FWH40_06145 [Coriobacteriia bacterium]|nr:hypothetical protein [Coriobacteriia bacterium]MCL2137082.1 hypothetical protein [Coriobacteriia bacterium]